MGRVAILLALASAAIACTGDDGETSRPAPGGAPERESEHLGAETNGAGEGSEETPPERDGEGIDTAPSGGDEVPSDPDPPTDAPSGTFHLDEPAEVAAASPELEGPEAPREETRIHMALRSTPSGARVLVDGEPAGRTPTHWEGRADGAPRDISFVLAGYELARYRFVPTQSGVVHATLSRVPGAAAEEPNAPESAGRKTDRGPGDARDDGSRGGAQAETSP